MDNCVVDKLLTNYYDLLSITGYAPINTLKQLIVMDFLQDLTNHPDYYLLANDCLKSIVTELYNCIIENNCLY